MEETTKGKEGRVVGRRGRAKEERFTKQGFNDLATPDILIGHGVDTCMQRKMAMCNILHH